MAIITIEEGSLCDSSIINTNFESLYEDIQTLSSNVDTYIATMKSNISSLSTTITSVTEDVESLVADVFPIGAPRLSLDGVLDDGEIWLEGAEVSKDTYSALYEVYGDTYGTPDDDDNFLLPDFRGRVLQGYESDFGHIEAGLPNITGKFESYDLTDYSSSSYVSTSGALYKYAASKRESNGSGSNKNYGIGLDASLCNSIYGNSSTVQPPAIIVRVKTRYI